ncbi:hypothetical protein Taro_000258, partial [Colocasia esculenta]|nr:hypothetical protein [Colocasia esculenta]
SWAAPGLRIPAVCLPADVATARYPGYERARVGSPRERTLELRGKGGLDSGVESFIELSCLGLGRRGVRSAFLAQTRQSLVSLPLSALVPEPRSGVRGSSSRELGVGRVAEAAVAPCVVSSNESEHWFSQSGALVVLVEVLPGPGGCRNALPRRIRVHVAAPFPVAMVSRQPVGARQCLWVPRTRASGVSRFGVLSVPWSRSWVPACDGTGVYGFPTLRCIRGPGWFYLWALDPVEGKADVCFFLSQRATNSQKTSQPPDDQEVPPRSLAEGHLGVKPRPFIWCQRPDMDANTHPGVQQYGRIVGDTTPLEETVETDSERGD